VTRRRAAVAVALAVACCCLGVNGAALAKAKKPHHHKSHRMRGHLTGPAAEARVHLKRANELAGDDDCDAAIPEYTKAYDVLEDPAVLYYRAECYRRLGQGEKAADDYRAYLDKAPKTPIRPAVEAKIAALGVPEPAERAKPAETAERARPPEPAARAKPTETAERAKPAETSPPPRPPPANTEPEVHVLPPAEPAPSGPPPPAPPPAEVKPTPVVAVQHEPAADDAGPARGTRPWVWVTLAVLVAGTAVGGYFMLRPRPEQPPESALGNYRF
jgi:hypothetical protein